MADPAENHSDAERFVDRCRDMWQDTICSMTLDVRDVRDTGL